MVIVGNRGGSNIGDSFARACESGGTSFNKSNRAWRLTVWYCSADARWHLCGHTPLRLERFSTDVVHACRERRPRLLLSVGIAPLKSALEEIGSLGCLRAIYLTDDPWSS